MATAQDIIEGAIQSLGVLGDGDTPTASELADGLVYLNEMLDSWTIDSMMVYQILQETKAITSGTTSITIGSTGDFNTTRPVRIENAFLRDVNNIDYQLQLLPQDSYQQIQLKSIQTSIPYAAYYDNAYPLGTLYFYPIPGQNFTLYMNSWKQLQQFSVLGDTVNLPPGYKEALRYSLAIRLASQYGISVPASVVKLESDAVARVKRLNAKLIPMHTEVGYIHKRGGAGSFSIYRGVLMRIGLGFNADSRDGTLLRDEKLVNFQLNPDGVYKRPGSTRTTYSTTAGSGEGIMVFGTKIYMWTGAMTTAPGNSNL